MKKPEFVIYTDIDKDLQVEIAKQCEIIQPEPGSDEYSLKVSYPGWEHVSFKKLWECTNSFLIKQTEGNNFLMLGCDTDRKIIYGVHQVFPLEFLDDEESCFIYNTNREYIKGFNERLYLYKSAYEILSREEIETAASDFKAAGYVEVEPNVFHNIISRKYITKVQQDGVDVYTQAWLAIKHDIHTMLVTNRENLKPIAEDNSRVADHIESLAYRRTAINLTSYQDDEK